MSQGKFSSPRPHREEEREIEKAYRDLTRKSGKKPRAERTARELPLDGDALPAEDAFPAEEAFPAEDIAQEAFPAEEELNLDFDNLTEEAPKADPVPNRVPKKPAAPAQPEPPADPAAEDWQIEDAFRKITGKPVSHRRHILEPDQDEVLPDTPEEAPKASGDRPQWMAEVLEFYEQNKKLVLAALCALAVMLIVFVILLFVRSAGDPYHGKILNNVYIGDVNVGGMTQKEAMDALTEAVGDSYETQNMVIDLAGTELLLSPKDSGASLNVATAVEEAYQYGRAGTQAERDAIYKASKTEPHYISLLPHLNLKTENIKKFLSEKSGNAGSTLAQTTYGLEGTQPELSADKFDKNAPCQTLVIQLGKPGVGFDPDEVYNLVLDAYSQRQFQVTVENVEILREPDPIDLEKIYKEFYIAPVNASVNASGTAVAGSYGYGFDLEKAKKLLADAKDGDEIRIPMEYIEPDLLGADSFFKDTLGEYQTRGDGNDNRIYNLRQACQALDGRVLNPGESLSFSAVVGSGYKSAPEDTGLDSTQGGGLAQVSSTLYCAALLSDLTVTSRSGLAQMPSYIGSGLDADTGLRLQNNLKYPVRINAQYSGGYVRVSISGTEDRDYYRMLGSEITQTIKAENEFVKFPYGHEEGHEQGDVIREGRDGYQTKSYTVRYNRTTNARIGSDYVATTTYAALSRQIAQIVDIPPEETTEETTEATTETTEAPTEAPTESTSPDWENGWEAA